jgi:hypothetical protein
VTSCRIVFAIFPLRFTISVAEITRMEVLEKIHLGLGTRT